VRTFVVCLKITVDTSQLAVDPDTGGPRLDGVPLRLSTLDENALEEAVRLKESLGGRILTLSLVPGEPPEELLLRALAMGADEAHLVVDPAAEAADSLAAARILSAAIERLATPVNAPAASPEPATEATPGPVARGVPEVILCGEGSIDGYSRQVGPRIGESLGVAIVTQVTRVEPEEGRFVAHRGLEDRTEIVEAEPPVLLSVSQAINEPRFPTVLQIMGASRKPVRRWSIGELGLTEGADSLAGLRTLEMRAPSSTRRRVDVEGETVEEKARWLVRRLRREGVVRS
jgi:electron transfer flavoprotein beta subunit